LFAIVFDIIAGAKIIGTHMPFSIRRSGAEKGSDGVVACQEIPRLNVRLTKCFPAFIA
jgi:hypothetical protein